MLCRLSFMKALAIREDNVADQVSFYHLAAFGVLLPFHFFYSQLVIISFAVHTLIHLRKERLKLLWSRQVLVQVSVFFIGLLSVLYSIDKPEGLSISGRQSAILFMPVLLMLNPLDLRKHGMRLLRVFALFIPVVILYLYIDAFRTILYFKLPLSSILSTAFINHNFSLPIGLHATYLAMYAAFSLFILLTALLQEAGRGAKLLYVCCMLVLFAGILQLTSRAVFAAVLVILPASLFFFWSAGRKRLPLLIVFILVAGGSLFIINRVSSYKLRYISELKNDLTQSAINNEILEPRAKRWELAWDLVRQSPFTGYGNGSEKTMMKEAYFRNRLYISYLEEFNVHSQYLSFLFREGVIGLLLFLYVLYYGFAAAIRGRNYLFFSFMALIAIVAVAENILDVNKGVFFYAFFLAFFLMAENADKCYPGNHPGNDYV
ncbi:MAG TPA: O-antigen ligase family protein [Ferruginibacter sp.]|nr:O-antigen ligase family protein [Ferruginibacter sp.]